VLPRLKTFFRKPVIANISGFSVEEYAYCCERIDRQEQVGLIEVNVSCPNVRHGGMSFGTCPGAAASTPLAAAYGLPRETPEQQARKAAVLAEALDGACAVPLDIMDACCEGIRLAADYAEKGSVLAVSDAGCAALFCKAALQASALNVAINTKLMTDRAHAAALDEKAARMLAEYVPLADEVSQSVASRLRA